MAQLKTGKVSGYFDCRVFKNGVEKSKRPMKAEGDRIEFTVAFSEYPKSFADAGGAEFIKTTEVNDLKRYYVTFKIGKFCMFFDKDGKKTDRPLNGDIDGKRYDAVIAYKVLHGDASKMEARGFWADAIQMKEAEEITFAPMDSVTTASSVTNDVCPDNEQYDELPY